MKKIIYSLIFLTVAFVGRVSAQSGNAYTFPLIAKDTLTNADTVTKTIHITEGISEIGIQVAVNKLSGTLAGKAYLFQSLDGANYSLTDSASYTAVPTALGSSTRSTVVTPTATNVATFYKTESPSTYYLVECLSTGTVSAQVKVSYTARKKSVIQKYQ